MEQSERVQSRGHAQPDYTHLGHGLLLKYSYTLVEAHFHDARIGCPVVCPAGPLFAFYRGDAAGSGGDSDIAIESQMGAELARAIGTLAGAPRVASRRRSG